MRPKLTLSLGRSQDARKLCIEGKALQHKAIPCAVLSFEDISLWHIKCLKSRLSFYFIFFPSFLSFLPHLFISLSVCPNVIALVSFSLSLFSKIHQVDLCLSVCLRPLLCYFAVIHPQPCLASALFSIWNTVAKSLSSPSRVCTYNMNVTCLVIFCIYVYNLLFIPSCLFNTSYHMRCVNDWVVILYAACVLYMCIWAHVCKCVSIHPSAHEICGCALGLCFLSFPLLLFFFPPLLFLSLLSFPLHQQLINLWHVQSLGVCWGQDQVNLWNKDNIS